MHYPQNPYIRNRHLWESFPVNEIGMILKAMFGSEIPQPNTICTLIRSIMLFRAFKPSLIFPIFLSLLCPFGMAQSVINRSLSGIETGGVLEPVKNTEVATAEMGVLREVLVRQGDRLNVGDPIARLDQEQQLIQVREAELELMSTGTLDSARSEFEFYEKRRDKTAKLLAEGKVSPKELERDQLELNTAAAKLKAQEEAKLIAKTKLDRAKILLGERTIRAPHAGTVVEVYRDVGEYIAGNAPNVVRLMDASKLRARFFLSDEAAEKFRKLQYAEIRLANQTVKKATIEFIAPFAIAEGHVIEMTVLIDNEEGTIRSSKCELVFP